MDESKYGLALQLINIMLEHHARCGRYDIFGMRTFADPMLNVLSACGRGQIRTEAVKRELHWNK